MINQITLNGVVYYRLDSCHWYTPDKYDQDIGILADGKTIGRLEYLSSQGITHCNDNFWPAIAKAIIVVFIIGWLIGNCL